MVDAKGLDREIRTTAVDFSFGELLNLHRDEEIIIRPEYQRLFRWSLQKRSRLIESIILGLPIPPIFLIENDNGVLELIDGLQRTSSVLQFLDHEAIGEQELRLQGCDIIEELNGMSFKDLPTSIRMKVKRTPIRATIINKTGDAYVKYEMFKRLNTGGELLTAQEIRNCSSRMVEHGASFYEAIMSMARYPGFSAAINRLPDTFKEKKADEELVLRFFAVLLYRDEYAGNIEEWLDSFMEAILFKKMDFDLDREKRRFEQVFDLIYEKLADKAFTRFDEAGRAVGRLAPAYYEAAIYAFSEHLEYIRKLEPAEVERRLMRAYSDPEFREATGSGANTITKLNQRIQVVAEVLGA